MPLWHRIKTLWRNMARRRRVEEDLDAEIRSYQAMLEDEKTRAGASPRVARREALLELGGAEQIKEQVREVRLGSTLESIGTELRQSLRGLRRNPALTAVGAIMLALGMGASIVGSLASLFLDLMPARLLQGSLAIISDGSNSNPFYLHDADVIVPSLVAPEAQTWDRQAPNDRDAGHTSNSQAVSFTYSNSQFGFTPEAWRGD